MSFKSFVGIARPVCPCYLGATRGDLILLLDIARCSPEPDVARAARCRWSNAAKWPCFLEEPLERAARTRLSPFPSILRPSTVNLGSHTSNGTQECRTLLSKSIGGETGYPDAHFVCSPSSVSDHELTRQGSHQSARRRLTSSCRWLCLPI